MEKRTVLHINTQLRSSSATVPYRIHEGFLDCGWQSFFLTACCDKVSNYRHVTELPGQHLSVTAARALRNAWYGRMGGKNEYYFFPQRSIRTITTGRIIRSIPQPPDLIIAYWTNFFFTQRVLHDISEYFHAPVLLYLMDEEPYTGGCHMTFGCEGYKTGCGNCPALRFSHGGDSSRQSVRRKKKWIDKTDITAVAASSYTYRHLTDSLLFQNKRKELVLLPIDEKRYCPGDKYEAREKLGLPSNKKILLFGGASFERKNKGMDYLMEALKELRDHSSHRKEIHIVLVGTGDQKEPLPFAGTHLGYQTTSEDMAQVYRACDVFVCPAIQDAGPVMINEAMMCGCPVVAFDMGVAGDLITSGKTGFLAAVKDAKGLAEGIEKVLDYEEEEWLVCSRCCRETAQNKCSMAKQIEQLAGLVKNYEKI